MGKKGKGAAGGAKGGKVKGASSTITVDDQAASESSVGKVKTINYENTFKVDPEVRFVL